MKNPTDPPTGEKITPDGTRLVPLKTPRLIDGTTGQELRKSGKTLIPMIDASTGLPITPNPPE